jgi:hypothetical protein
MQSAPNLPSPVLLFRDAGYDKFTLPYDGARKVWPLLKHL